MCARSETKLEKDLSYKRDSVGVDNLIYRKDNWLLRGINIEVSSPFRFSIESY